MVAMGVLAVSVSLLTFLAPPASAHPGNTDRSGCHVCRTNCPSWGLAYDERHCHGAPRQPSAPIAPRLDGGDDDAPAEGFRFPQDVPLLVLGAASGIVVLGAWGTIIFVGVRGLWRRLGEPPED